MTILTWGAEGRAIEDLQKVMALHGVQRVVDVRLSAGSGREGAWTQDAVEKAVAGRYIAVPELGSTTMRASIRKGAEIVVKDFAKGLRRLGRYFNTDSVWLFLGEAEDPAECSRGMVADAIARDLSGVAVRHVRLERVPQQGGLL